MCVKVKSCTSKYLLQNAGYFSCANVLKCNILAEDRNTSPRVFLYKGPVKVVECARSHVVFIFLQWNYPLLECSMAWRIWRVSFHFDVTLGFLGRFVSSGPVRNLWQPAMPELKQQRIPGIECVCASGPLFEGALDLSSVGAWGALAASSCSCTATRWTFQCGWFRARLSEVSVGSTWVTHATGIGRRSQNEFGHGFVFYMFLWNLRRINRLHGQMLPYGCGSQHWLWVLLDLWLMADLHLRNFNRRDSIQRKLKKQQLGITGINSCHHTLSQLIHVYCI